MREIAPSHEPAHGRHRVVVVGAGFGGLETVQQLAGSGVDITLVDRRNHHLFQPVLYQVAGASLSPSEIAWARATPSRLMHRAMASRPCGVRPMP
jgi:NADH dehydrogenase